MNAITKTTPQYSLAPQNFTELVRFAELVAKSDLAPKDYVNKPGNVMIAVQMGVELGLSPMQSLSNISVINGRASVWGDAMLALCQTHPSFEDIEETNDGTTATCTIKRKGRSPTVRTFSMEDAKKAGLANKSGPWTNYPKRMLQMRARGVALRDSFADVLRGLHSAEESIDLPPVKATVSERPRSVPPPPPADDDRSPEARALQAEIDRPKVIDLPIDPEEYVIQANGKNKGKELGELDDRALDWYAENSRDPELKNYASIALAARREKVMAAKAAEYEEGTRNSWVAGDRPEDMPEPGAGDQP